MFSLAHTFFYFFILIHRLVKWADTYTILPRLANRWVYDTEFSRSVVIMSVPHSCTKIACIGIILCHYTGNLLVDRFSIYISKILYQKCKRGDNRSFYLKRQAFKKASQRTEHYHSMLFFVVIRVTSMFAVILEP